jgi:hypothetical protein
MRARDHVERQFLDVSVELIAKATARVVEPDFVSKTAWFKSSLVG